MVNEDPDFGAVLDHFGRIRNGLVPEKRHDVCMNKGE
jgi:hypothetical protein